MLVFPRLLWDVISVMPEILPNCRSSGVATEEAIVSGLAPGKEALTEMVGKSTCGRGETGNSRKATAPDKSYGRQQECVATGRRMKSSEGLMCAHASNGAPVTLDSDLRKPCADRRTGKSRAWYTSVRTWLKISPPIIAIPSGRRNSEPDTRAEREWNAAEQRGHVVIMIGRKRSRHAW